MQRRLELDNGFTVSIVDHGYGSPEAPFEVWAWRDEVNYPDDPRGWQTQADVDSFVAEVANL